MTSEARPAPIDAPTLLALLPTRAGSWKHADAVVRPKPRVASGAGRVVVGDYTGPGGTSATLTLTDLGAQAGLAVAGQVQGRIVQKDDAGEETLYPEPGLTVRELVRADGKGRELSLTLTNGFVVTAASPRASFAELRQLADGIDRQKLARLRAGN